MFSAAGPVKGQGVAGVRGGAQGVWHRVSGPERSAPVREWNVPAVVLSEPRSPHPWSAVCEQLDSGWSAWRTPPGLLARLLAAWLALRSSCFLLEPQSPRSFEGAGMGVGVLPAEALGCTSPAGHQDGAANANKGPPEGRAGMLS